MGQMELMDVLKASLEDADFREALLLLMDE